MSKKRRETNTENEPRTEKGSEPNTSEPNTSDVSDGDQAAAESPIVEKTGRDVENERKSFVDMFFDAVTHQTARSLTLGAAALKVAAQWLDGRAKVVGEIASKLSSPPSTPPHEEQAQTNP